MKEAPGCIIMILLFAGFMGIMAYENKQDTPTMAIEPIRIEVAQVMEHEVGRFSIKYLTRNGSICERYARGNVTLMPDVPEGKPMWIIERRAKSPNGRIHYFGGTEIHIHSVKEINGAGWNHGKHGSGQTNVIESE